MQCCQQFRKRLAGQVHVQEKIIPVRGSGGAGIEGMQRFHDGFGKMPLEQAFQPGAGHGVVVDDQQPHLGFPFFLFFSALEA